MTESLELADFCGFQTSIIVQSKSGQQDSSNIFLMEAMLLASSALIVALNVLFPLSEGLISSATDIILAVEFRNLNFLDSVSSFKSDISTKRR